MMLHGAEGKLRTRRQEITLYALRDWNKSRIETDADLQVVGQLHIREIPIKGRASHYVSFAYDNQAVFVDVSDIENPWILNDWYGFAECCFLYHRPEEVCDDPSEDDDDDDPIDIIYPWTDPDPDPMPVPVPDPVPASIARFQPSRKSAHEETTVQDLANYDESNMLYAPYVTFILQNILTGSYALPARVFEGRWIEPLAVKLATIFRKVYLSAAIRAERGKAMCPHPVQVLSVLRLADEVLNGPARGAIAEIKTGEGKSFIIAALSILLVLCGRKVDIATSNMELASRDQKEQKKYYDLFGIASDILFCTKTECAYVDSPPEPGRGSNDICEYSLDSLDAPIVYSTHTNYEWLYLRALFYNTPFRKRPYDIVIVDEADCALLDGARNPAYLEHEISIKNSEEICRFVWDIIVENPFPDEEDFAQILCARFPHAKFTSKTIKRLIRDAKHAASGVRLKEDYIIKGGKIEIIDHNTGFLRMGCRWTGFLHSMVEIKEGQKVRPPSLSISGICHRDFFMLYEGLCGVTGTAGGRNDRRILSESYGVNIFDVPRNRESRMKIADDQRTMKVEQSFGAIAAGARRIAQTGQPVLIIFGFVREVDEFADAFFPGTTDAGRIKGLDPYEDRPSIQAGGRSGRITIATYAAGRGTDIKLDHKARESGGLYVIVTKVPAIKRHLDQLIGRAGRQGDPGAAMRLLLPSQRFYTVEGFDESETNLCNLQTQFTEYIKSTYSWLFKNELHSGFPDIELSFGCDYKEVLDSCARWILTHFTQINIHWSQNQEKHLTGSLHYMITLSWGMLHDQIKKDPDISNSKSECSRLYDEFLDELHKRLSKTAQSSAHLLNSIQWHLLMDWATNTSPAELGLKVLKAAADVALIVLEATHPEWKWGCIIGSCLCTVGESAISKWMSEGEFDWKQVNWLGDGVKVFGGRIISKKVTGKVMNHLASGVLDSAVTFAEGVVDKQEWRDNLRKAGNAGIEGIFWGGITSLIAHPFEKLAKQRLHKFRQETQVRRTCCRSRRSDAKARQRAKKIARDQGIELDDEDLETILEEISRHDSRPR
jgi:hypothetical protein